MKKNLFLSINFIIAISVILKYLPYIKEYDIKIRFNIYRSLMCTYFVIKSIEFLKNQPIIFGNYFEPNELLNSLFYLFLSYLIIDIIYTLARSKKRIDLLLHHLVVIIVLILIYRKKLLGNIFPLLLLNEAISIVSGFDCVEMSKQRFNNSILLKNIENLLLFLLDYLFG